MAPPASAAPLIVMIPGAGAASAFPQAAGTNERFIGRCHVSLLGSNPNTAVSMPAATQISSFESIVRAVMRPSML